VFRCDAGQFPQQLTVGAEFDGDTWMGELRTERRNLQLTDLTGVYYRRPTEFSFEPGMSANEQRWAAIQARLGFGGLLATVGPWLNHPHRIGFAEYKPVQLKCAARAGLRVPPTLITNDPPAAYEFARRHGGAVCKPFGGIGVHDEDGFRSIFATAVTPDECRDNPGIARTMHLFQRQLPKDYEVRLTVVDDQFFAARIDAESDAARADWRADYQALSYRPWSVPDHVRAGVRELLDALGLRFGALDFVVADDEWWFLEINPNGQWAWIEDETALPIAAAIADALEGHPA
jgi:ATP-grasp ribosomal peptide maturase